MCWKHEDIFSDLCFDFLWDDYDQFEGECVINLLRGFDVKFNSHEQEMEARKEFFDLLTSWYNSGYISPKNV